MVWRDRRNRTIEVRISIWALAQLWRSSSMTGAGDLFSVAGKTAVVTGTSAGIGARLARTLLLAGARVAAISRRETVLDEEAMATGRLTSLSSDLADHDQTMAAADECLAMFDGRVDILVNN